MSTLWKRQSVKLSLLEWLPRSDADHWVVQISIRNTEITFSICWLCPRCKHNTCLTNFACVDRGSGRPERIRKAVLRSPSDQRSNTDQAAHRSTCSPWCATMLSPSSSCSTSLESRLSTRSKSGTDKHAALTRSLALSLQLAPDSLGMLLIVKRTDCNPFFGRNQVRPFLHLFARRARGDHSTGVSFGLVYELCSSLILKLCSLLLKESEVREGDEGTPHLLFNFAFHQCTKGQARQAVLFR